MRQRNTSNNWWQLVMIPFSWVFFFVMIIGMVFYVVAGYESNNFEPFALATVVGLLGGFSFTAAFSENCEPPLRSRFRLIGALYLFATISFVVFGLYQPVDKMRVSGLDPLLKWVIPLVFYLGALPFIGALLLTLWSIPKIIGMNR